MSYIRSITIRFYQELNYFLPGHKKAIPYEISFKGKNTIKDIIEAEGVPHVEIDLILVNGRSVDFNYHPENGEKVSVYPEFELLDISPLVRLRPLPLRRTRFLADANLGRLARYLRMLGFDTVFDLSLDDPEIIQQAAREKRIILTRDLGMLKDGRVTRGYFLRHDDPQQQIREVVDRFSLSVSIRPFTRCIACNGRILPVSKSEITNEVPPRVAETYEVFFQCSGCKRVFWKGSHYDHMLKKIEELMN